jgi:hypothetical protein
MRFFLAGTLSRFIATQLAAQPEIFVPANEVSLSCQRNGFRVRKQVKVKYQIVVRSRQTGIRPDETRATHRGPCPVAAIPPHQGLAEGAMSSRPDPAERFRLPDSFASVGDPIEGNPFPVDHPLHQVWIAAPRKAEEEVCHNTSASLLNLTPGTRSVDPLDAKSGQAQNPRPIALRSHAFSLVVCTSEKTIPCGRCQVDRFWWSPPSRLPTPRAVRAAGQVPPQMVVLRSVNRPKH